MAVPTPQINDYLGRGFEHKNSTNLKMWAYPLNVLPLDAGIVTCTKCTVQGKEFSRDIPHKD